MVTIEVSFDTSLRRHRVKSFAYDRFLSIPKMPSVSSGRELPSGLGFPFKLERPQLSFKTYRSLCDHGLKNLADGIIRRKFRSTVTPDYVWQGVLNFAGPQAKRITNTAYDQAYAWVVKEMTPTSKITPLSLSEACRSVPQGTSPGLPYIRTHPGWKKGRIYDKFIPAFSSYWDRVGRGEKVFRPPDCAAFARSHICKVGDNKVRPVWAYPASYIAQEARFAHPLTRLLTEQTIGTHTAYGMEMMKGGMQWLHNTIQRYSMMDFGSKYVMTDYSGFDAKIPAWLIRDAFRIIYDCFDMTPEDDLKFKKLIQYFINTPIQNMDGRRFQKDHGVPSGSMFTNIVGTICNLLMTLTVLIILYGEIPPFINVFGDDGVFVLPSHHKVDFGAMARCMKDMFGSELNVKKSYWTRRIDNIHYLGYYNYNGSPVKPTEELLAALMYPQYNKDDWAYCIARSIGCAFASAGMNYDVFLCCSSVWLSATAADVERAYYLLEHNPRMKRHMVTMGCDDMDIPRLELNFLHTYIPRYNCTKLVKNIF